MSAEITEGSFEEIYRRVSPQLFGFFRRRGVDDPADLVAEAFAIAWRSRSRLVASASERAWLFGIARRLLLTELRRRGREQGLAEALARSPEREEAVDDEDRRRTVLDALGRLNPEERELILLIEWERLSPAEAAQALGIKPGTARVRLHRARQNLAADDRLRALLAMEVTA